MFWCPVVYTEVQQHHVLGVWVSWFSFPALFLSLEVYVLEGGLGADMSLQTHRLLFSFVRHKKDDLFHTMAVIATMALQLQKQH